MNEPDRLTPSAAKRLRGQADAADARADQFEAGADRLAPRTASGSGAGYRERREADRLRREAKRERAKAGKYRARAGRADGRVTVSDHALVRYLERRYGLDVAAYHAEILPPAVAALAGRLGDGKLEVETPAGSHFVTIRGGCVVTVVVE